MVAIARALMARPRLLSLDEPSLGLSPLLIKTVFKAIAEAHRSGTSLLLVEQTPSRLSISQTAATLLVPARF
jgi:branched-chain amino acid transport system ATP-binding protein